MNYRIKDEEKKYAKICLENFNQQMTLVNENLELLF